MKQQKSEDVGYSPAKQLKVNLKRNKEKKTPKRSGLLLEHDIEPHNTSLSGGQGG